MTKKIDDLLQNAPQPHIHKDEGFKNALRESLSAEYDKRYSHSESDDFLESTSLSMTIKKLFSQPLITGLVLTAFVGTGVAISTSVSNFNLSQPINVSAQAQQAFESQGRYHYIKESVSHSYSDRKGNFSNESESFIQETWTDIETGDYRARMLDTDENVLDEYAAIDDKFYYCDSCFPEEKYSEDEIPEEDYFLEETDEIIIVEEGQGFEDLTDEEKAALLEEEIVDMEYIDEEAIEDEAMMYNETFDLLFDLQSTKDSNTLKQIFEKIKENENVEVSENIDWEGKQVHKISFTESYFEGEKSVTNLYFDTATFMYVGSENIYENEYDIFTSKQVVLDESYSEERPADLSSEGLTLVEEMYPYYEDVEPDFEEIDPDTQL